MNKFEAGIVAQINKEVAELWSKTNGTKLLESDPLLPTQREWRSELSIFLTKLLESEPVLPTQQRVRVKPERPGAIGRHNVSGLRGYTIKRFRLRQEHVWSTVSPFVLSLMGSLHEHDAPQLRLPGD